MSKSPTSNVVQTTSHQISLTFYTLLLHIIHKEVKQVDLRQINYNPLISAATPQPGARGLKVIGEINVWSILHVTVERCDPSTPDTHTSAVTQPGRIEWNK